MIGWIVGLVMIVLVGLGHAATTFVSTTGSDSNGCGAGAGSPKRNIAGAQGCAACLTTPGDVCQVEGGATAATAFVYTERLDSTSTTLVSGVSGNPMTVRVTPGEYVIIRPNSGCSTIKLAGPDWWVFDGAGTESPPQRDHLILDGRNLGCGASSATNVDLGASTLSENIVFKNMTIRDGSNNGGTACSHNVSGRTNNVTISNVDVNGTHLSFGDYHGSHGFYIGDHGGDNWIIEDSLVHDSGGIGIQFNNSHADNVSTGNVIRRSKVYNNGRRTPSGQQCSGTGGGIVAALYQQGMLVYSNWIYGNLNGPGISTYGATGQGGHQILNNTFYGNVGRAVEIGPHGNCIDCVVKNNIAKNNGLGAIRVFVKSGTGVVVDTTMMHGNGGSGNVVVVDSGVTATVANSIVADPLLVNAGAQNFHLNAGSPAIGAGLNLLSAGVTTDIDNATRNAPLDIGGDETEETTPVVLVYTSAPTAVVVDVVMTPAVVVCAQVNGVTQVGFAGSISIAMSSGTGVLTGGTGGAPTSGCRTFAGLSISATGSKTLTASASGAASVGASVSVNAAAVQGSFVLEQTGLVRMP